jgi:ATP-dependent DNA ligase
MILHFVKGVGIFAHSRSLSIKTYRRQSLEDHLLFSDLVPDFSAVIDAEGIVNKSIDTRTYATKGEITKSSLHSTTAILQLEAGASKRLQQEQQAPLIIKVFDIANWEGKNLKEKKLCERLAYIADVRTAINQAALGKWFEFPPISFHGKRAAFDKIVREGGEGIVLKNLNSTYEDSNSRKRNS